MYQIYSKNDQWVFSQKGVVKFEGSLKDIVKSAIVYGIEFNELEIAVDTMIKNDHNAAEFGMFKSFIFSFNKKVDHIH